MDDLQICRNIHRIYTCCGFDINTNRLTGEVCNEVLTEYFLLEPQLKNEFSLIDIEMSPTGVLSCFSNITKIVPELFFIYKAKAYPIPDYISESLSTFLHSTGISRKNYSPATLYFGYTGRYLSRETGTKYITDGLQRDATSDIIIDFATYENAAPDTLHHRLIHELLHAFGITEDEMPNFIYPACIFSHESARPFIEILLRDCSKIYNEFKHNIKHFQEMHIQIAQKIDALSNQIYMSNVFPVPSDTVLKCLTFHPISFSPVKFGGKEVMFM